MIQLITCGPDNKLNRKLTLLAHESCREMQIDSETLLETLRLDEVPLSIREAEATTLCTMVYHRLPEETSSKALYEAMHAAPHESLLIAFLKEVGYLADIINAGTKLSGVMVPPLDASIAKACYQGALERHGRQHVKSAKSIVLQYGRQSYKLDMSAIVYLEALNKMVNVYTMTQCITVSQSLKDVLTMLDKRFLQCHRSYVVNTDAIQEVNYPRMELLLLSGETIPFSRSSRAVITESVKAASHVG